MNSVAVSSTGCAAAVDLVSILVEDEILELKHVAGQSARGAAEDRLDPRDDLGEAERLRHVVVAAGAQRLDLVLGRVLRRQEEHGGAVAAGAQAPADLEAVDVREHPVEHDQIRLLPGDQLERVPAVRGLVDLEALVAERGRDGVDDRRLVVDDEDPLCVPVRGAVRGHGQSGHEAKCCGFSCEPPVNRLR